MNISLSGQRCLVTGASGFIGSRLARLLVAQEADVRVLVRRTSRLTTLQNLPMEVAYGDVTSPSDCRRAMEGIDYLFHVAGQVQFGKGDPEVLFRVNRDGVRFILEAALAAKVKRCVITSSVAAIGPSAHNAGLIDETLPWDETLPRSPYSRSKHEGETDALRFIQKGLSVVAVNPSLVIGAPDEGPSIGGKLLLMYLKRRFKAYMGITFNCVDVEDVARGHLLALLKGKTGERYILGEKNLMLKELFELCERSSGIRAPTLKIPYGIAWGTAAAAECFSFLTRISLPLTLEKVRSTRFLNHYSNAKARRELSWDPKPIEETLPKTLTWLREYHLKGRSLAPK